MVALLTTELRPRERPGRIIDPITPEAATRFDLNARLASPFDTSLRQNFIPHPGRIRISEPLVTGHFFERLIRKSTPLNAEDIQSIIESPQHDLQIHIWPSGIIPASTNPSSSYSKHFWTRDLAHMLCALEWTGHREVSAKVLRVLNCFYGSTEQRDRISSFMWGTDAVERYAQGNYVPFIRGKIDKNGEPVSKLVLDDGTVEDGEKWGHCQLDAIGMWLWCVFRFANHAGSTKLKAHDLREMDRELHSIHPANKIHSLFVTAIEFLNKIQYYQQSDLGPWEERLAKSRASGISACVAALREAKKYFDREGWDALPIAFDTNKDAAVEAFKTTLEGSLQAGIEALKKRVPDSLDGLWAKESDLTPYTRDAALIFTLYPVDAGFTELQQVNILRTVYTLMGEVGFRRYRKDPYAGEDHHQRGDPYLMADVTKEGYREAEWFFDLALSAYFYRRFDDSKGSDLDAFLMGDMHLKRGLMQVTAREDSYYLRGMGKQITIPSGTWVEAHFWDSVEQRWRPNCNSPLYWTKASAALALERGRKAALLAEAEGLL